MSAMSFYLLFSLGNLSDSFPPCFFLEPHWQKLADFPARRTWTPRRVVLSKDLIAFAIVGEDRSNTFRTMNDVSDLFKKSSDARRQQDGGPDTYGGCRKLQALRSVLSLGG